MVARPVAVRRSVSNLIENALHYGGNVRVAVRDRGDLIEIEVADDGPGIPDDQLEEVLQPFVRLDNARSRDTQGWGWACHRPPRNPVRKRPAAFAQCPARRPSRDHPSATRARLSRRCCGATIPYSPAEQRKNHPLSLGTSPECKSRASSVLQELTVNELIGRVFSFEKTVFPTRANCSTSWRITASRPRP
jgi:hypothetical protein